MAATRRRPMTSDDEGAPCQLAAQVRDEIAALDRELNEIDMLVGQARAEAARHEQKRVQAHRAPRHARSRAPPRRSSPRATARSSRSPGAPCSWRRRSTSSRASARRSPATATRSRRSRTAWRASGPGCRSRTESAGATASALPPTLSRVVAAPPRRTSAARSPARCTTGPAQSLTNIVLQAQIVERLFAARPGPAPRASSGCSFRWSSRPSTRPRTSSSTCARWCSTTWASCPRSGARRASAAGARTCRWSSSRWAGTGGCRWTSRARCSGSSTRRWPPTCRRPRSGSRCAWTGASELEAHLSAQRTPPADARRAAARGAHRATCPTRSSR